MSPSSIQHFNEHDFKHCLGCFTTGVAVIGTIKDKDNMYGITVNSFSSVSLEPPLVLFNIDKSARNYGSFTENKYFSINILNDTQKYICDQFAFKNQADWSNIPYEISKKTNTPLIKDAVSYLECEQYATYEGGDHTIIVGRVLIVGTPTGKAPLVYHRGHYYTLTTKITGE